MIIRTITAARLINTGNYEYSRFEVSAEIEPGEGPMEAMNSLNLQLTRMIEQERERRFPNPEQRRYAMWIEEDEREQA
jgi:hypothetical protein